MKKIKEQGKYMKKKNHRRKGESFPTKFHIEGVYNSVQVNEQNRSTESTSLKNVKAWVTKADVKRFQMGNGQMAQ